MTQLNLNSTAVDVHTLGPGPAIAIWVQGCHLACRECTSPETWAERGARADPSAVAGWANSTPYRLLTISGGEPFDQAGSLCALIDELRAGNEWVITCYSGYVRERLERDEPSGARALLARLDVLIDGPYVPSRHAALLWRGSTNQRIHDLTGRARIPSDQPAGVAAVFDRSGGFTFIGVPEVRGFRALLAAELPEDLRGTAETDPTAEFPFPTKES